MEDFIRGLLAISIALEQLDQSLVNREFDQDICHLSKEEKAQKVAVRLTLVHSYQEVQPHLQVTVPQAETVVVPIETFELNWIQSTAQAE